MRTYQRPHSGTRLFTCGAPLDEELLFECIRGDVFRRQLLRYLLDSRGVVHVLAVVDGGRGLRAGLLREGVIIDAIRNGNAQRPMLARLNECLRRHTHVRSLDARSPGCCEIVVGSLPFAQLLGYRERRGRSGVAAPSAHSVTRALARVLRSIWGGGGEANTRTSTSRAAKR